MTENDTSICSICRRPKRAAGKGTLTQWIVVCNCDFDTTSVSNAERMSLCQDCGKRVVDSRPGSLTQWVLRSDSCKCAFPKVIKDGIDAAIAEEQEQASQNAEDANFDDEIEMDVPAGAFPIERYKPLSEIGTGALGVVYLCRDRLLGKIVAIKCLRSVSPEQMVSFQMEAKATSQLKHPGVVSVMDFGSVDGGAPYMVMEYIEGFTLEQTLSEDGPLSLDAVVSLFGRAADALEHAHQKGIFHRDLKSSNIMIVTDSDQQFDIRIIDFGIATFKQATLEPTQLKGNSIVGTPAYMSPDQALGLTYDARSEVYSLGCVMFEALTGRPPFVGNTALETISMHARTPAPKLRECASDFTFPDDIEDLMATALAKDRDARFQSMQELKEALDKVQTTDLTPKTAQTTSKSKFVAPAIVSVLLLISAAAGFVIYSNSVPSRAEAIRLNNQAWRQVRAEHYGEALENAQRSFKRDPNYAAALDTIAVCQLAQHDNEEALKTIDEALALAKKNKQRNTIPRCYFHKGLIHRSLYQLNAGTRNFDESIGYNPELWEITRFRELLGKYQLDWREARRLTKKQRVKPTNTSKNIIWHEHFAEVKAGTDQDLQTVGQSGSIKQLYLLDGAFTEAGIKHLHNLKLEKLIVLSAAVPSRFFQNLDLGSLKTLEIANQASFDPEIFNKIDIPNLESLRIDSCSFPDRYCVSMLRFKKLRGLEFVRCPQFTGNGWEAVKKIQLNTVGWIPAFMSDAKVDGTVIADTFDSGVSKNLQASKRLESYDTLAFQNFLSSDSLETVVVDIDYLDSKNCNQLSKLKNIRSLDLCGTTSLAPHHLRLLTELPRLETLSLRGPIMRSYDFLSKCRNLKDLRFTNAELTSSDVAQLSKLKLDSLYISQITILDECFPHIFAMQHLKKLTFGAGLTPKSPSLTTLQEMLPNCIVEIHSEQY